MSGFYVPQLMRKVELLIHYGYAASKKAIAEELGVSPVTLRGWANGASGGPEDTVTAPNVDAFIALFAAALPDMPVSAVCDLLSGPADDLENLLNANPSGSLNALIAREADTSSADVIKDKSGELGLVRRARKAAPAPRYRIALGQAFRIEFHTRLTGGFVLGLQAGPNGWGVVPATLSRDEKRIHLPGPGARGDQDWLIEDNDVGHHRFIAAQATSPFPAKLVRAGLDGIPLDRTLLADFQRHFEAQNPRTRKLFAVDIAFERASAH